MQRFPDRLLVSLGGFALALVVGGGLVAGQRPGGEHSRAVRATEAGALAAYGRLPMSFEPNRGQGGRGVRFLARGAGYQLGLIQGGAVLALHRPVDRSRSLSTSKARATRGDTIALRFLGANPHVRLTGRRLLPGKVNYLIGKDPGGWLRGVPTYGEVRYRGLYPGIDARFYGRQGGLEYDLVLAPGADPTRLKLAFQGAESLRLDSRGGLTVRIPGGTLVQRPPRVYQTIAGQRRPISGGYILKGRNGFRFRLGAYDTRRALVIDPVLSYSTYLGGSGFEIGRGIAIDAGGSAYVTGETGSADFPTTPGALDASLGIFDAFVSKLAPGGSSLVYSTYLGGSDSDFGNGIAVDASGSAYLTGGTFSADFPTTPGGFDTSFNGADAFVTKLTPNGSSLLYSTYLGGSAFDGGSRIAVDASGSAYVTGLADSADFPTTSGAFDTSFNGGFDDAFVTKLAPSGSSLLYSTYLGGSGNEAGADVALDSSGSAYLTGFTSSSDFPTTPGAFDTSFNGADAFVTKLAPSGSSLAYATYLGVGDGFGIAVDASGSAYVTGSTSSSDFPTTPRAFDTSFNGAFDAFVTKLTPSGSSLLYSTHLGGSELDFGHGIAVDATGSAYLTGGTFSADFPTTPGAFDTSFNGVDAFLTKLLPSGSSLLHSTYLGGSNNEDGLDVAVDASGSAYLTGFTSSSDFPTTLGAFNTAPNGDLEAFVAKLTPAAVTVLVDIKPGSERNPINLAAHGLIPVAILSSESFDATTIDPASVCFGDAGDASQRDCSEAHGRGHLEDVNGDGRPDLLLHFETQQTGIDAGDTAACLSGTARDGLGVEGCDSIETR